MKDLNLYKYNYDYNPAAFKESLQILKHKRLAMENSEQIFSKLPDVHLHATMKRIEGHPY
jgi:hypothetical protein